jgi:hypothetical protein
MTPTRQMSAEQEIGASPIRTFDPFWWSIGGFVLAVLMMVGVLGYFGSKGAMGCACERESGRCMCKR